VKIDRKKLTSHLEHIHCGGLLPDVVLSGQFQGLGVDLNKQVMVQTGPLEGAEPLANEIGVTNLGLLIEALEDDQVNLTVEDRAVVVSTHDRTFRLATSAPRVIGTRIEDHLMEKVSKLIPVESQWHPLEHRTVKGVRSAARALSAEVVTLAVKPTGSEIIVGDPRLNVAQFELPDFKAAEEYSILLSKDSLLPVLNQLSDFTKAEMTLTGPDSVIGIREGSFSYIISPDKAENKKK
jgi:hypothetical protein